MKLGIMIAIVAVAITSVSLFLLPEVSAETAGILAEDASGALDHTDMTWVLVATILVFMMAPALALFYGGMLRKQSMTSTIAQCIMGVALVFVIWAFVGYSLAFSGDFGGFIGDLGFAFMHNVPYDSSSLGLTIPDMEFLMFQGMFAGVTACIVIGASAERARFSAMMLFLALWSVLVYAPMAHMVWGGGLLSTAGGHIVSLDYAGGTVVHICAGITGVAIATVLGKRSGRTIKDRPHSIPWMYLGAILLWLGWIGFNGGSGLAVNGTLVIVVATTIVSSTVAMLAWGAVQVLHAGRVSVSGMCAGFLSGLVAITPACAFVSPASAALIGAVAAAICYFGVIFMRKRSGVDDALDVFGIRGIGGIWGAVATGIFASSMLTDTPGLIDGGVDLFAGQLVAVGFTLAYCFAASFVIMKAISLVMRIRYTEDEELIGGDIAEHGESAYN